MVVEKSEMRGLLNKYLVGLNCNEQNEINRFLDEFESVSNITGIIELKSGNFIEIYVCNKEIRNLKRVYERYAPTFSIMKLNDGYVLKDKPKYIKLKIKNQRLN